jgi:hypothetical protein
MTNLIKRVQDTMNVPLSIDSSVVAALQAGLETCDGKALAYNRIRDLLDHMQEPATNWTVFSHPFAS